MFKIRTIDVNELDEIYLGRGSIRGNRRRNYSNPNSLDRIFHRKLFHSLLRIIERDLERNKVIPSDNDSKERKHVAILKFNVPLVEKKSGG